MDSKKWFLLKKYWHAYIVEREDWSRLETKLQEQIAIRSFVFNLWYLMFW